MGGQVGLLLLVLQILGELLPGVFDIQPNVVQSLIWGLVWLGLCLHFFLL